MLPEKKTASFKPDYVTTEPFYLQNDYISLTLEKNVQIDDETVEQCETNETWNGHTKVMTESGTNIKEGKGEERAHVNICNPLNRLVLYHRLSCRVITLRRKFTFFAFIKFLTLLFCFLCLQNVVHFT